MVTVNGRWRRSLPMQTARLATVCCLLFFSGQSAAHESGSIIGLDSSLFKQDLIGERFSTASKQNIRPPGMTSGFVGLSRPDDARRRLTSGLQWTFDRHSKSSPNLSLAAMNSSGLHRYPGRQTLLQ